MSVLLPNLQKYNHPALNCTENKIKLNSLSHESHSPNKQGCLQKDSPQMIQISNTIMAVSYTAQPESSTLENFIPSTPRDSVSL